MFCSEGIPFPPISPFLVSRFLFLHSWFYHYPLFSTYYVCQYHLMLVVGLMVLGYHPRPRMVVGFGKCTGSQSPTAALPVFAKSFLPFYWYNTTNLSTTLVSFTNQPNGLEIFTSANKQIDCRRIAAVRPY